MPRARVGSVNYPQISVDSDRGIVYGRIVRQWLLIDPVQERNGRLLRLFARSPGRVCRPILTALLCGLLICLTVNEQANPFRLVLKSLLARAEKTDEAPGDDEEEDAEGKVTSIKALVRRVRRVSSPVHTSALTQHTPQLSSGPHPTTSFAPDSPHKRAGVGIPLRC